jgi:hypothetical protein
MTTTFLVGLVLLLAGITAGLVQYFVDFKGHPRLRLIKTSRQRQGPISGHVCCGFLNGIGNSRDTWLLALPVHF